MILPTTIQRWSEASGDVPSFSLLWSRRSASRRTDREQTVAPTERTTDAGNALTVRNGNLGAYACSA